MPTAPVHLVLLCTQTLNTQQCFRATDVQQEASPPSTHARRIGKPSLERVPACPAVYPGVRTGICLKSTANFVNMGHRCFGYFCETLQMCRLSETQSGQGFALL